MPFIVLGMHCTSNHLLLLHTIHLSLSLASTRLKRTKSVNKSHVIIVDAKNVLYAI